MEYEIVPRPQITKDYTYDCNLCNSIPNEPITTPCGHIFCWPCIFIESSPYHRLIKCHTCSCIFHFKEIVSLMVTNKKERTEFIYLKKIKIPPRPAPIVFLENRNIFLKDFCLGKRDKKRIVVFKMKITKKKVVFFIFIVFLYIFSFYMENYPVLERYVNLIFNSGLFHI